MPTRAADVQRLFVDPDHTWSGVSPALLTLRRIAPAVFILLALPVAVLLSVLELWWLLVVPGVVLAGGLFWWFWLPVNVRAWQYAETDDDLLVTHGRLLRHLTVVPYGRMQVIDVEAGPLASKFGIASVQLVTASASTDAKIPGLPVDVAHDLRNRLTAKGEAMAAGL
ncbi:MAG: PH domain-containing protein [Propionibacteriales bacterium]|nr:PH domain-containing protein [Propionibacteriales bacterium]